LSVAAVAAASVAVNVSSSRDSSESSQMIYSTGVDALAQSKLAAPACGAPRRPTAR
jgi:hypothetical protein